MVPATPYSILSVRIGMKLTPQNVNAFVDVAEKAALQRLPAGTAKDLRDVADHILFVLPFLKDYSASAEFGVAGRSQPGDKGYTLQASSKYAPSLSILMHEFVSKEIFADFCSPMTTRFSQIFALNFDRCRRTTLDCITRGTRATSTPISRGTWDIPTIKLESRSCATMLAITGSWAGTYERELP